MRSVSGKSTSELGVYASSGSDEACFGGGGDKDGTCGILDEWDGMMMVRWDREGKETEMD